MDVENILSKVDHTILLPNTVFGQIVTVCDEAVEFGVASVCIPPCYVLPASKYLNGKIPICTVVGFPAGYSTLKSKITETIKALEDGAKEIDMVINIGYLKDGRFEDIFEEIRKIKNICGGHILKVIIETCLLSENEKIEMCKIVTKAGADFIKTSTGFSHGGATLEDIVLFSHNIGPKVRIKASGGIRSFEDAAKMIESGAHRLGASGLVRLAKNLSK